MSNDTSVSGDHSCEGADWPPPKPFNQHLTGPKFPVRCFPKKFRRLIVALAASKQIAASVPATYAFGFMGCILQGRLCVQPKPWDSDYVEELVFHVLLAMISSGGKSEPFRFFLNPIRKIEKRLMREAAAAASVASQKLKKLEDQIAQAESSGDDAALARLLAKQARLRTIVNRSGRLLTQDATPEGLLVVIARDQVITIAADELHLATLLASRWNGQSNFVLLLQGYSGTSYTCDRATKDSITIDRPRIGIVAGVQPSVVEELFGNREAVERGLVGRMLVTFPGNPFGGRTFKTEPLTDELKEYYSELVESLLSLEVHDGIPPRLVMSEEAAELLADLYERTDTLLAHGNIPAAMYGFYGKLHGHCARVAGVLHVLETFEADDDPDLLRPISAKTMANAIQIMDFFSAHARLAYESSAEAVEPQRQAFERVLALDSDVFTRNELFGVMKGSKHVKTADDLSAILDALEARNFVVRLPAPKREGVGRKPSPRYRVNPLAAELFSAKK